jgi:hypothetical protein
MLFAGCVFLFDFPRILLSAWFWMFRPVMGRLLSRFILPVALSSKDVDIPQGNEQECIFCELFCEYEKHDIDISFSAMKKKKPFHRFSLPLR